MLTGTRDQLSWLWRQHRQSEYKPNAALSIDEK